MEKYRAYRINSGSCSRSHFEKLKTEIPIYLQTSYRKVPYAFSALSLDFANKEKWYIGTEGVDIMLKLEENEIVLGFVEHINGDYRKHLDGISKLIGELVDSQ